MSADEAPSADDLVAAAERARREEGAGPAGRRSLPHVDDGSERKVILFRAGRREYALPIDSVERTQPMPTVNPVPRCPPFVLGVASPRGEVVCVVDLHGLLEGEPDPEPARSLLVVSCGGQRLGLTTCSLPDFTRLLPEEVVPVPDAGGEDVYSDTIDRGVGLVGILDPEKLFGLVERRVAG